MFSVITMHIVHQANSTVLYYLYPISEVTSKTIVKCIAVIEF